jgi:putative hydrolase of the HAD superfamily
MSPDRDQDADAAMRGVVFDFFGTLTIGASVALRAAGAQRLAAALGVDRDPFVAELDRSFYERATGAWGDMAATLAHVARTCGVEPTSAQLAEACRIRWENERGFLTLRPEADVVLEALSRRGLALGLISDCTHELPALWASLPIAHWFGATEFSVCSGRHKPDPAMYTDVAARLGVEASRCLYVGDGGSNELTGAVAAGLTAVLLDAPDRGDSLVHRREVGWTGPVVRSLAEVPALFDEGGHR